MDTKAEKEILERIEELNAEAKAGIRRMEKLFKEAEKNENTRRKGCNFKEKSNK